VTERDRLEDVLEGASLWGLELDPRYRVLAATFEPTPDSSPRPTEDVDGTGDRRLQVLLFPVSTILASLRQRQDDGRIVIRRFRDDQLVEVVSAFEGAAPQRPLFDLPEPRPGEWAPEWSLEGRSTAPDGTGRTFTVHLRHQDLELDLFARFDDLELKDAAGAERPLPNGEGGG
jgi:hypothetical protein